MTTPELPDVTDVICPKCQTKGHLPVFQSVNSHMDPKRAQALIDGSLFQYVCGNCGEQILLHYPILFHDLESRSMVQYLVDREQTQEVLDSIYKMRVDIAKAMKDPDATYRNRIVYTLEELREKSWLFRDGFDDAAMEVVKELVRQMLGKKDPAVLDADMFFAGFTGEKICLEAPSLGVLEYPVEGYERVLEVTSQVDTDSMIFVDRAWAKEFLAG